MYVEMLISATEWTFQLRDESGAAIGTAQVWANDTYRLERNTELQSYIIQNAELPQDNVWPVVAAYPYSRTIVLPD